MWVSLIPPHPMIATRSLLPVYSLLTSVAKDSVDTLFSGIGEIPF
jgi:hypothetical protein